VTEVNDINETIRRFQPVVEKVSLIMDHVETLTGTLAGKKSLVEMAVSDKESVNAFHGALKNAKSITQRVDNLLKRTDEELYGKDGIKPAVVKVLQELVINLQKMGKTLDNASKISADAADSTKDLKLLRSEIDEAVNAVNNLVDELNKLVPFKSDPKIRLP
jgi:phospholipid/cholesterol/gamma-HCH transport system substrate-binding protein